MPDSVILTDIESQSQSPESPLAALSQNIDLGSTSPRKVLQINQAQNSHAQNHSHTQNLLAPQSRLSSDYFIDGYISDTFTPRNAEGYLAQLFNVRNAADIQAIRHQSGAFYVLNRPSHSTPPALLVNGQDAWLLDHVVRSGGSVVPQQLWFPQGQGYRRRYVEQAQLRMPVFFVNANGSLGVPVMSAAIGDMQLHGAYLPAQLVDRSTLKIRIGVCTCSFTTRAPSLTVLYVSIAVARL